MQKSINESFNKQTFQINEIKSSFSCLEKNMQLNIAKDFFVSCDLFRIMNNTSPTSERIRQMVESIKVHHNIDVNLSSAINYNKNGGYKKKENKEISYLND